MQLPLLKTSVIPPYVLALFEGAGDPEPGPAPPPPPPPPSPEPSGAGRGANGRFESVAEAERRIGELNKENADRRRENSDLTKSHKALSDQVTAANSRAIRGEVRAALISAKVIDSDVLDLVLKQAGDSIKIDDKTGDVVGVSEAIEAFKKSKPRFFEVEQTDAERDAAKTTADDEKAAADKKKADAEKAARGNSTAGGSSVNGGGAGSGAGDGTIDGLPDLRLLSKEERKVAVAAYERRVRGGRNR